MKTPPSTGIARMVNMQRFEAGRQGIPVKNGPCNASPLRPGLPRRTGGARKTPVTCSAGHAGPVPEPDCFSSQSRCASQRCANVHETLQRSPSEATPPRRRFLSCAVRSWCGNFVICSHQVTHATTDRTETPLRRFRRVLRLLRGAGELSRAVAAVLSVLPVDVSAR